MPEFVTRLSRLFAKESWLDGAAKPVQNAISWVFKQGGAVGQQAANLLNGTWLGHPLHPVLTDLPIGSWTTAVVLDSMETSTGNQGFARAADVAVAIGVAGATGSAISGLADWQHTTGESRRMGLVHATLNTIALGLYAASMVARATRNREKGRGLALAGFAIASASAYFGGDLVYRQRIGVNHAPEDDQIETRDFVPVLAEDQLPENRLTIATLNTIPLVLLRRENQVYALAETCAHLGGPLADGRLVDGPDGHPVVVCPWHGSNFDMENGDVLQGPSAYPQPCFEARIRDGQVEVRHLI